MTLIEYLTENEGRSRICLPRTYQSEVMAYERVDENDSKGRKWFKVYFEGTDCKYGAFMICPDTKQQRPTTMSEFYGGAVVD